MIESEFQENVQPSTPFPWPPPENESVLEALVRTWKESVFEPKSFFARMPREFGFGWVIVYYLIIGVLSAGISLFWEMVLGPSVLERWVAQDGLQPSNPVVDFLLSPLWLMIALYVVAGIMHVCLLMVRGARHGFGATARVIAYCGGPQLFSIVPFVGPVVGAIWSLVITVIGFREAHETTTGRAIAALAIPFAFLLLLTLLALMAALVLGLSGVRI